MATVMAGLVTVALLAALPSATRARPLGERELAPTVAGTDAPPALLAHPSAPKLDAALRSLVEAQELDGQPTGDATVDVLIMSSSPMSLGAVAEKAVETPWLLGQVATIARVKVGMLRKLAAMPVVYSVEDPESRDRAVDELPPRGRARPADPAAIHARLAELLRRDLPYAAAPPPGTTSPVVVAGRPPAEPSAWGDVRFGHRSAQAWEQGWRGEGVKVAIVDGTGFDFASPEIMGTWAVNDSASPYAGWPMALDAIGLYSYVRDLQLGRRDSELGGTGHISMTQTAAATWDWDSRQAGYGKACFKRVLAGGVLDTTSRCDYRVPNSPIRNAYRFGAHPDPRLEELFGERVGILLADMRRGGGFDTVYIDLDNDHDFTDEKPVTKDSPLAYRDMDADGWADLSGGLVYWVADGVNPPPGGYLWGDLTPVPIDGGLVTLIYANGSHGTLCASNVVAQGRLPLPPGVQLRFRDLPGDGQPAPILIGAAPAARLVAINHGPGDWRWAAQGMDPLVEGDGPQIVSTSFAMGKGVDEGWDDASRWLDHLGAIAPSTTFLFSAGNGGPGYGSIRSPNTRNSIKVAASTETGSTGFDSITETNQITWGDIQPFSARGPAADGTIGPHVAANGAWGSGAVNVNATLDGSRTVASWGGTSRAAPVTAGNLALSYQAFKQRTGSWPSAAEAKALLMAGALNRGYDTFTAGAGVVDGGRSAAIAGGLGGLYAEPPVLYPGDYRGRIYPSFTQLVQPGATYSLSLTLHNPGPSPIAVELKPVSSRRIGSYAFDWTSQQLSIETMGHDDVPDYVIAIPRERVPPGTDLLTVRLVQPQQENDVAGTYRVNNKWELNVYQHTDINHDGEWWHDRNSNGTVDKAPGIGSTQLDGVPAVDWTRTEIDRWEAASLADDYRPNNNKVVSVGHPLERWRDGLFIGLQHYQRSPMVPVSHLKFRVDFYSDQDWPWLALSPKTVTVPAGGAASVAVAAKIPAAAAYGYFQGSVVGRYTDDLSGKGEGRRLTVPVLLNVAASLVASAEPERSHVLFLPLAWRSGREDSSSATVSLLRPRSASRPASADPLFELGGAAAADPDLPYPNGLVRGMNYWGYSEESGDSRFYFVDVKGSELPGEHLVLRSQWQDEVIAMPDGSPPLRRSDVDSYVFGPARDWWTSPGLSAKQDQTVAEPDRFGPYGLALIGSSAMAWDSDHWKFASSSGLHEDWVSAPLRSGLNLLVAQNTMISGAQVDVPFAIGVGRMRVVPTAIVRQGPGCGPVRVDAGLAMDRLLAEGIGLSAQRDWFRQTFTDTDRDEDYAWRRPFTATQGTRIGARLTGHDKADDLDLAILYDFAGAGPAETRIASASTQPGADESLTFEAPVDGSFAVAVDAIRAGPGSSFDVSLEVVQGRAEGMRFQGLPEGTMPAGGSAEILACFDPPSGTARTYHGDVFLGPPQAPRLIRIPVVVQMP